jgi:Ku70/Ku80-like protein
VPADDDELDAITIDSNHTIEIDSFVPRQQIDQRYLDSPYHITPNDQVGQEAFAVIREAMRDKGMAAFGRVVLAKRERVIMLQPWDKGLMGRHCAIHTRLGMGKNLDALRRSIAQEQAASAPHKKRPKHLAGQGEMLLPVSGRKAKEAVAKPAE